MTCPGAVITVSEVINTQIPGEEWLGVDPPYVSENETTKMG